MGRKRKELLSSAPWRTGEAAEDEDAARMSREGKVSVTSNPGETPTMSMPRSKRQDLDLTVDDFEEDEIDPELRYSFQRNSRFLKRVFSVDTLVKPLPPVMAYSVSRNINFFFRIFTQFWVTQMPENVLLLCERNSRVLMWDVLLYVHIIAERATYL
ncbi:uncharacterized protein [Zea mays]|uniref:Uncharacterized protein n=1 Tax=Zea mays TaxID=4577 RepID=A0A804PQK3_MAIZE|nr:uncharacterized protein LOC100277025 isoform X1 [Zea mays]|eukprot:XP_008647666.1 uncharacterized protein LOC100277025 isoform X1 [Zea mays]